MASARRKELMERLAACESWDEVRMEVEVMQDGNELPNDILMALLTAYSDSEWWKDGGRRVRIADVQDLMREVYGIDEDIFEFLRGHILQSQDYIKKAYAWCEEFEAICSSVGLAFVAGVRTVGATDFSFAFGMTKELDDLMDEIKGQLNR